MPNTHNRQFSYSEPVLYQGTLYPSAKASISDGGTSRIGNVFADANGQYYYLNDSDKAIPASVSNTLDEVVVTPSQQEMLANAFGQYLTMGNDNTKVSNVPHREYNPHLKANAIRGAKYHAQWEKEHPNVSSWAYAASAAPFVVAAAPIALGAGDAIAGTALGQAAINGAKAIMANPLVEMANTAAGLSFGAKGAYDVSQGNLNPSTALELMGLYPGMRAAKGFLKTSRKPFTSELDWTPEGWFGTRANKTYDAEDVAALQSHVPEYLGIERETKANGTWLKMPDGSTWKGDPRSWVMYKSENVRNNYMDEVLSHGEHIYFNGRSYYTDMKGNDKAGEILGTKSIWTSTNPNIGATYGQDVFSFVIPKNVKINTIADAQGRGYKEVLPNTNPDRTITPFLSTDRLVYPNLTDNNIVRIDNVVDPGVYTKISSKDALPKETVSDYLKRKYIGDDLVLGKNVRRKSLYGNNGNFDIKNPDVYKGLIPFTLGLPTLSSHGQPKE